MHKVRRERIKGEVEGRKKGKEGRMGGEGRSILLGFVRMYVVVFSNDMKLLEDFLSLSNFGELLRGVYYWEQK
jgi:hypothetical protein